MRIIFIRHGDPDYAHDTLTEKGRKEAALLAEHFHLLHAEQADFYVSPLGRARDTAAYVLDKLGREAQIREFLQELPARADVNDSEELRRGFPGIWKEGDRYGMHIAWDMGPAYWTEQEVYFDKQGWRESELAAHSNIVEAYDHAAREFDALLASYGYVREGRHYRVEREFDGTIVCFCHLGITCALLAHLWSVSPVVLLHSLAMAPTSVTEVCTEERQQGTAYFRASRIGDVFHLRMGGEEPSFAGRFCEVYSNPEQRH